MKQHITVEQLNQLSEKGKERLREWWKPDRGDKAVKWLNEEMIEEEVFIGGQDKNFEITSDLEKPSLLPLLSIGQMIEFLDDYREYDDYLDWGYSHVIHDGEGGSDNTLGIGWEGELADALWEACRELLEKI